MSFGFMKNHHQKPWRLTSDRDYKPEGDRGPSSIVIGPHISTTRTRLHMEMVLP